MTKKADITPMKTKDGVPLKQIGVSFGITINMGDYESARIDVWETAYVTEEEKEEGYRKLWNSVEQQVSETVSRVTGEETERSKIKKKRR